MTPRQSMSADTLAGLRGVALAARALWRARDPRALLRLWISLARERRALRRLTDAELRDLGRTRAEAEAEARRPFWDAPAGR